MIKRCLAVVAMCGSLMTGGAAQAHHSVSATYDIRREGAVTGVVTRVAFTNPHGAIHLAVEGPDGATTEWVLTTGSANTLQNLGFGGDGPNTIVAGDEVTITYYPARNDSPLGFIRSITLADQRQVDFEIE